MKIPHMFCLLFLTTASLAGEGVKLGVLVSGEVAEIRVARGQEVEKGELLLRLDDTLFKARVSETQVRLKAAEAVLRQADRELERARELYERTLLADYELQQAQVARLQAEAEVFAARARLLEARTDLHRTQLQAPFAGRIARVFAYRGQMVQNSLQVQPLIEMTATTELPDAKGDAP